MKEMVLCSYLKLHKMQPRSTVLMAVILAPNLDCEGKREVDNHGVQQAWRGPGLSVRKQQHGVQKDLASVDGAHRKQPHLIQPPEVASH